MPNNVFTIDLMKSSHDCHLDAWPVTVVDVPFGEQNRCLFHSHDCMEIGIITQGRGVHIMDGERALLNKGDVILVPPGRNHGYDVPEGDSLIFNRIVKDGREMDDINIPMGIINILYDHTKLPIPLLDGHNIQFFSKFFPVKVSESTYTAGAIMNISDPKIMDLICYCAKELNNEELYPYAGNLFGSTIRLLNLILTLLRNNNMSVDNENIDSDKKLGNILAYVNSNYMNECKVPELARKFYISTRQLQEKFKKFTGRTISDYIICKRIECAQLLLNKSTQSIQEIAFDSGFNDFSYFSKKFREITGVTPREYRKNRK